ELPGGRTVATRTAALLRSRGLAADLHRRGHLFDRRDAPARVHAAPAAAGVHRTRAVTAYRSSFGAASRLLTWRAAGDPLPCRTRVLRGDVDAASPHRRVLRRPGLRSRARRRNALAHARLRHREPACLR